MLSPDIAFLYYRVVTPPILKDETVLKLKLVHALEL